MDICQLSGLTETFWLVEGSEVPEVGDDFNTECGCGTKACGHVVAIHPDGKSAVMVEFDYHEAGGAWDDAA